MKEKDYITFDGVKYDVIETSYGWVADTSLEKAVMAAMEQGGDIAETATFTDNLFVFYVEPDMMARYDLDEISAYVGLEIDSID